MDVVADLVIAPFKEIVEKATTAHENAQDNKEMLAESQKLIRGAERTLKTVVPLCTRLYAEFEGNFIDELKQHDEIARYRLELNDLLWDFEDFMEADAFEKEAYVNLQKLCKNAGLAVGDILRRMKLEPIAKPPADAGASPASTATAHVPGKCYPPTSGENERADERTAALSNSPSPATMGGLNIIIQPEPEVPTTPEPQKEEVKEEEEEERLATPPPPPPTNPWDIKSTPNIDTYGDIDETEDIRRAPVSSGDSDIVSPSSPEGMHANSVASPPRRLDEGVEIMEAEERRRRMTTDSLPSRANAAVQPEAPDRNPFQASGRSLTSSSMATNYAPSVQEPEFILTATILPPREHRDSLGSSVRSRESMQESLSPAQLGNRGSVQSIPENPDAITGGGGDYGYPSPVSRAPTIPANFPPGIQDGIEIVPKEYNAGDGLIPVESEESGHSISAGPRMSSGPPRDCSLSLNSSFFLYKGFCEGAKETTRGGSGVKVVKKPGFQGSHTVARCTGCDFESDSHHLELDQKQSEAENFVCSGVGYRVRFLQKSHMATKRSDEQLFGCVFCAHSQHTLEECDATVFFTSRKLFEHLARHPRPLPQVPGFTVVEEAEVPFNLRNNYDLHFKRPQVPSPLDPVRDGIIALPTATAIKPVRKMYGMRMLHDQTPAFELADGARITGIEFPAKYQGEWALGWHDAAKKSVPFDVIRLVPPPKNEVKMGGTSTITAVARWKFAPKAKDGEWLKFDKGEFISNISFAYSDHWCWSGTNAKGKWGIFPQTFIDTNTVREFATDRASIISNESRKKFRFSISRKGGGVPPSTLSGPAGGSIGRVF